MGSNPSRATGVDVRLMLDRPEISSDEERVCKICGKDLDVFFCKECNVNICKRCCEHCSKRTNPFYYSSLVPIFADTLHLGQSLAIKKQTILCGIIGQKGKVVVLQQLMYKDNTFECRLRYLRGRQLCVAKRQPNVNKSVAIPGDLCFVENENKLYLTLPCKMMVYSLYRDENFKEEFSTPLGGCFGITPFNNGLALSIQTSAAFLNSKWQIQFVDLKGNILRRIQNNNEGKAYFGEPLNLVSSRAGDVLFISDKEKNAVFAFNVRGEFVYCYHGITVRSPLGIAADKFDNVYVACGKKVIQIEKGGEKSRELPLDIRDIKIVSLSIDSYSDTLIAISESGHFAYFNFC